MYRSISGLTARRREMALVVALGLGAAMLVASPAAPASASATVRTIHFYPTPNISVHVFMACTATAYPPIAADPVGGSSTSVVGLGSVDCVYEDGTPANSPHITLDETLIDPSLNDAVTKPSEGDETGHLGATAINTSCSHGTWTSSAEAVVDVPLGWRLGPEGTTHVQDINFGTLNFGDCSADYTYVPNLYSEDPDEASLALQAAGLQLGSVCPGCTTTNVPYLDGEVMVQSIAAGTRVLRGTTVDVTTGWFNPDPPCGDCWPV
jgi:hypothetical protein